MTVCSEEEEGVDEADIGTWTKKDDIRFMGKYYFSKIRTYETEFRTNPLLIQVIEELGDKASGRFSKLSIVEIPDDVEFTIEEYDGFEHVAEAHRTWG
jgi:hypothetical protein